MKCLAYFHNFICPNQYQCRKIELHFLDIRGYSLKFIPNRETHLIWRFIGNNEWRKQQRSWSMVNLNLNCYDAVSVSSVFCTGYMCLWDNIPCHGCVWRGDYAWLSAVLVSGPRGSAIPVPPKTSLSRACYNQLQSHAESGWPSSAWTTRFKKSQCATRVGKAISLHCFSFLTPRNLYSTLEHSSGIYHQVNVKQNYIYIYTYTFHILIHHHWTNIMKHAYLTLLFPFISANYFPQNEITTFNSLYRAYISLCLCKYAPLVGPVVHGDYKLLLN